MPTTQEFYAKLQDEMRKLEENLKGIKHRIVVFSGKGGVGKTMFSINLAYSILKHNLCEQGRVGLLDADITTPNVPKLLGIKGELRAAKGSDEDNNKIMPYEHRGVKIVSSGFMAKDDDAIVWRGPLRSKLINQFLSDVVWNIDYLITDLPPGTGDEVLTIVQSMKPDIAIIITTPQDVSLLDARRAVNMAKKFVNNVFLVENMSYLKCPNCGSEINIFGRGRTRELSDELNINFLGELPLDIKAREATEQGSIPVLDLKSDFTTRFDDIINKMKKYLENA